MTRLQEQELVVGITPFEEPNAPLAVALARAGAVGVLDLGHDAGSARAALADVCRWWSGGFGVRVPAGCPLSPADLPEQVRVVVHGPGSRWPSASGRRAFVEVTSVVEAHAAVRAGVYGLIAKGAEAGGRVGTTTTFVMLQQLLADPQIRVPVWAAGGIGPHTAAAAIAGGAAGIVLERSWHWWPRPGCRTRWPRRSGRWTAARPRSSGVIASTPALTAGRGPRHGRGPTRRPEPDCAADRPGRCAGRSPGAAICDRWGRCGSGPHCRH